MMFVIACVLGGALAGSGPGSAQPPAQLALQQLQADFHGASTYADYELMHSLWADDAVAMAAGQVFEGPDEIADFFSSSPNWGVSAALSPTYKTTWDVHGDTALLQFECVIVNTGDLDPLTTPLSTIPFGGQNPDVEIVQHSTATCTAVRQDGRWVIQTFVGSAGPPQP
jgi:ketosteroid isomerase-like protein